MNMSRLSSTQGYIEMANELLRQLKIPKRIERLEEIGANIFVPLYEGLCGERLPEIQQPALTREEQRVNLQAVIDGLSTDVLHVSLSHIRAEDIMNGDRTAICNLLEIFQGLMEYLLHHMDSEDSTVGDVEELNEEDNDLDDPLPPVNKDSSTPFTSQPDDTQDSQVSPGAPTVDSGAEQRRSESPDAANPPVLTAADLHSDLARSRIRRADREADEAGFLAHAVSEAVHQRRRREEERAGLLRRQIREYLATRRDDLDLLAGDLRPRAVDRAEEEWLQDYLRMSRRRPMLDERAVSPFRSPEGDEDAQAARRLRNLVEEHTDRVEDVKARRKPRVPRARRPEVAPGGPGPVAATAEDGRLRAERSQRSAAIRRDILRDCYDQSLAMAGDSAEDLMRDRRQRVEGKENAIRRVAALKDGLDSRRPPRGTSGLVRPQVHVCARAARPLPHEATAAADSGDPDRDVLAYLVDQFPYLQLSNQALNEMWLRANRQRERLARPAEERRPMGREEAAVAEAQARQKILAEILRKELGYNRRLRDRREREAAQRELRARERERRMQAARAKKYYDEFSLQMRAKMLRNRDKEETLFRRLFKEALRAQKERIHDMRRYSRDVRDKRLAKEMDEIKSLENFYRDRFQILAESLKNERKTIALQDNEQTKLLRQLKKELRGRLEHDIRDIQASVRADQEDDYFRERNAERILCDIFRGAPVDLR